MFKVFEKNVMRDNTIAAQGLDDFFENLTRNLATKSRKTATKVMKNAAKAVEIGAEIGSEAESENLKAASSTAPVNSKFFHTERLYLG